MAGTTLSGTTADFYINAWNEEGLGAAAAYPNTRNIAVGGDYDGANDYDLNRSWFEFNTAMGLYLQNVIFWFWVHSYGVSDGMDIVDELNVRVGTTEEALPCPADPRIAWSQNLGSWDAGTHAITDVGWGSVLIDYAGTRVNYGGHTFLRVVRMDEGVNNTTGKWLLRSANALQRQPYLEGTYRYPVGGAWDRDPSPPELVVRIPANPSLSHGAGPMPSITPGAPPKPTTGRP